jgi:hypothetical protein
MIRKVFSVLTACLFVILAGSLVAAKEETVTLTGQIEAAEYDTDGNVASVAVYDMEKGSVLISKEGKGKELLSHVGVMAKITGTLVELDEESEYPYVVKVASYTTEGLEDEPAEGTYWDHEE